MTKLVLALGLLLSGLGITGVAATPIAAIDVPALVAASDLIVVGRADTVTVQQRGPGSATQAFAIAVTHVIKDGGGNPSRRLHVELDSVPPGQSAVVERQSGIFFLRRRPGGDDYTAVDPAHPALIAAPNRETTRKQQNDPLAAVAHELTRVLTTPAVSLTNRGGDSQTAAQYLYYEAADALKSIPYATAGAELSTVAAADELPAKLWALNCLVAIGSPNDREMFALAQIDSLRATLIKPPPELEYAVYWLASAMEGSFRSRSAVRVFAPLLASGNAAVRRVAAATLSRIATPDVVAPLARVALNDKERDVRFFAVQGLAWATKAAGPTKSDFEGNEGKILQQWRDWARTNVR